MTVHVTRTILDLFVAGRPFPQGSKAISRTGVMYDASAKGLRPWRKAITVEARERLAGRPAYDGPVYVSLGFTFSRALSHWTKAGVLKADAPAFPMLKNQGDLDKLIRAVLDGLTAAKVWEDDRQVVALASDKLWHPQSGVQIEVMEVSRG